MKSLSENNPDPARELIAKLSLLTKLKDGVPIFGISSQMKKAAPGLEGAITELRRQIRR